MSVAVAAVVMSALAGLLLARALAPPPPRLASLIRAEPLRPGADRDARALHRLLAPHLGRAATGSLERRLRQARLSPGGDGRALVLDHCARVAGRALTQGAALGCALLMLGAGGAGASAGFLLGALGGAARQHASVDRAIEERRMRMRIELYTVNQLLALDVRAGGGVAQALERICRRGEGAVADELRDVLATVRAGMALHQALEQAADMTVEPAAARTYRLLAKGARFGTDLAVGLRALNEDLRAQRGEAIERTATKRRAAMLLPIIGLLAPVMLLFIAAPLPSIVFGTR